jgi:DNA-binding IclR family transcriptional regulator
MISDSETAGKTSKEGKAPTRVRSVARGARVLKFVAGRSGEPCGIRDIAAALGLPVPTAFHIATTLVDERMLAKDEAHNYTLGSAIAGIADSFHRQLRPPQELLDRLRRLVALTGESAYVGGWRHGEVVVFAAMKGQNAVQVTELYEGFTGATHARASGKLLLAHLPEGELERFLDEHPLDPVTPATITSRADLLAELKQIQTQGYALEQREFNLDVGCVSAPLLQDTGAVAAVFTVSSPIERLRGTREQVIEALREVTAPDAVLAAG